jgi:hypothetical protein
VSILGELTMAKTLTATDRKSLIRLASTLPVGSEERRAILAGLRKTAVEALPDNVFYEVKDLARDEAAALWGHSPGRGHGYSEPDTSQYRRVNRDLVTLLKKIQRDHGEDALDEALDAVTSVQEALKAAAYKRERKNLPDPKRPRWASTERKR